jgi:hypothetical protein
MLSLKQRLDGMVWGNTGRGCIATAERLATTLTLSRRGAALQVTH